MIIGIIERSLAGFALWAGGIDGAAFWGTIVVILSVIPGIGSALVWVPAVIYLFAERKLPSGPLSLGRPQHEYGSAEIVTARLRLS